MRQQRAVALCRHQPQTEQRRQSESKATREKWKLNTIACYLSSRRESQGVGRWLLQRRRLSRVTNAACRRPWIKWSLWTGLIANNRFFEFPHWPISPTASGSSAARADQPQHDHLFWPANQETCQRIRSNGNKPAGAKMSTGTQRKHSVGGSNL
jgi:hypothetical protein